MHILDVFGAGKAIAGGKTAQFPNSETCANCHADIVKEWRRLGDGARRDEPVHDRPDRAGGRAEHEQPKHALGQLCVNCHGPIGATDHRVADAALPGDVRLERPGATGKHNLILAEGVSCVVCHALGATPGGRAGADPCHSEHSGNSSLGTFQGPPQSDPNLIPVPGPPGD